MGTFGEIGLPFIISWIVEAEEPEVSASEPPTPTSGLCLHGWWPPSSLTLQTWVGTGYWLTACQSSSSESCWSTK